MIKKLMTGMAAAISSEFGDNYEVYIEKAEQGVKSPCFLITCQDVKVMQHIGVTYQFEYLFFVQYFPKTEDPLPEYMDIQERLSQALEYIEADGLKRGTDMKGEVREQTFCFQATYKFFLQKQRIGENMGALKILTKTKG